MHMADALLSPPVAGVMLAATAGTAAWCIKRVREDMDERRPARDGAAVQVAGEQAGTVGAGDHPPALRHNGEAAGNSPPADRCETRKVTHA